jgi:lysophospholipase L1-like esterase
MSKNWILFLLLASINMALQAQTAPRFYAAIKEFNRADSVSPISPNCILFTGSSSFTKWKDLNVAFPGYPVANRAFGGSTLLDLIRYSYEVILPYKPKQVVIYCGENDLAQADSISAAELLLRVKTLFSIIRINLPNTVIDYVSIKPSPVRMSIQHKVKDANRLIKSFIAHQKNAHFIDLYDAMLDKEGHMREELYVSDRLHMKPEGYAIWQKKIAPFLLK